MAEYIEREALLAAYDKAHKGPPGEARKLIEEAPEVKILFLCDRRQCKRCGRSPCTHTTNIAHAMHFEKKFGDLWVEVGAEADGVTGMRKLWLRILRAVRNWRCR